ncbi:uncharacterized protein LOC135436686 [Drosophila montana]|uniref:uncharacterized protein LOC135436686 n=1 Tax=Drosophila montana TaxID=40370 RepID=UPI00313AECBD
MTQNLTNKNDNEKTTEILTGILNPIHSAKAKASKSSQCTPQAAKAKASKSCQCTPQAAKMDNRATQTPPVILENQQSTTSTVDAGAIRNETAAKICTFWEKKSAEHILLWQNACRTANQSAEWLKKIKWARGVLPNFAVKPPNTQRQPKRKRSSEAFGRFAKKSRIQPPIAQITTEMILIGVLDYGSREQRVPMHQWKWVEAALAIRCIELLKTDPGPPPVCNAVGWYWGSVKVIACEDRRSAELYKTAIENIGEIYPGANLVAVDWIKVPVKPCPRLWSPSSMMEPERILKMRCNPILHTKDWKVINVEEVHGATNQVIILNKESLAPIVAACSALNLGVSSVTIKVYKCDATAEAETDNTLIALDLTSKREVPDGSTLDSYMLDNIAQDIKPLCRLVNPGYLLEDVSDDDKPDRTVMEGAVCTATADKLPQL